MSKELPERIWANAEKGCGGFWACDADAYHQGDATEYIRADLAAPSAPAETERLRDLLDGAAQNPEDATARAEKADRDLTALQAENERLRERNANQETMIRQADRRGDDWKARAEKAYRELTQLKMEGAN